MKLRPLPYIKPDLYCAIATTHSLKDHPKILTIKTIGRTFKKYPKAAGQIDRSLRDIVNRTSAAIRRSLCGEN